MNTDESKLKAALIRKRRIELNWKQEAFAKSLPMANSSFSEMERGLRPITEELYRTISNKLEMCIRDRLQTVEQRLPDIRVDQDSGLVHDIVAALGAADPEIQRHVGQTVIAFNNDQRLQ